MYTLENLTLHQEIFKKSKNTILTQWVSFESPKRILKFHNIDPEIFIDEYAGGVFDYFMGVVSGELKIGDCPVMHRLLIYLKDRETSADEVFDLCSHFRKAMVNFTYDAGIDSRGICDEIWYMFDTNFRGVLQYYTNSIFKKLIDAKHEAQIAGQAKDYFLSNMSHEIRTPLNAILGFVNLMLDENITRKQNSYLNIIQDSGENLLSIINDILDFSKLQSGEFSVEPKFFSIHDEVTHTLELFTASAISKNITITSFINPLIPKELFGDSLRIKQILSNFLSNAIKFTKDGGVICVEASCDGRNLEIGVTDNGIGINESDIKNIFTAFAQAQFNENSSHAGTGLGLSICLQLAKLMNGEVNVDSSVGEGSCFSMKIPIDIHTNQCKIFDDLSEMTKLKVGLYSKDANLSFQYETLMKYFDVFDMNTTITNSIEANYDVFIFIHEEIDAETKRMIYRSSKKFIALMSKDYEEYYQFKNISSMCFPLYCSKIYSAFEELSNKSESFIPREKSLAQFSGHILVSEDNEANQELIKIILTKYGLTFDVANNGFEAFELYKNNNYDLILMDEQMPIMDGNEAVALIIAYENENKLRHIPISALTANVIKGAKERGLLNGFDSFLGKPIIMKDLEKVFSMYLKIISGAENVPLEVVTNHKVVFGLNMDKLREELVLNDDEIIMLVNLFIKKMNKSIPELKNAIDTRDYKTMQSLSHTIKGSSANFRLEELQIKANTLEEMARERSSEYDYISQYKEIQEIVSSIKIV